MTGDLYTGGVMDGKLSKAQLSTLRAVAAGEDVSKRAALTLGSLWRRGLITSGVTQPGPSSGLVVTDEGRLALRYGRQMLSGRSM